MSLEKTVTVQKQGNALNGWNTMKKHLFPFHCQLGHKRIPKDIISLLLLHLILTPEPCSLL